MPHSHRSIRRPRPLTAAALAVTLIASLLAGWTTPLAAESPGHFTIAKTVEGFSPNQQVEPGETFTYQIEISCSNLGIGGCTSAEMTDVLPEWVELTGTADDIVVSGLDVAPDIAVSGQTVTIAFNEPLADPAGAVGMLPATTVRIAIPARVSPSIPPSQNGEPLTNVATVTATNADEASASFTVVPDIAITLAADVTKAFTPDNGLALEGTATTLGVTATNVSNVAVDRMVVTDPTDPSAAPNPFDSFAFSGDLSVTLPEGADQVRVDVWDSTVADWVTGDPSSSASLPGGVDVPDIRGIRLTYLSTDGADIAPGAAAAAQIGLVQRAGLDAPGVIANTVTAVVGADGAESDPATGSANYSLNEATIALDASKRFDPDEIVVGGTSTVTLGATNSSSTTLDSLTITEPSPEATNNIFSDSGFTFDGFTDAVQWPTGADTATITYSYADGLGDPQSTTTPDTLPGAQDGRTVTGFSVSFSGPIVAGAEALVSYDVIAPDTHPEGAETLDHDNQIAVSSTAPGGYTGSAEADDVITTIVERLALETTKSVFPEEIPAIPGEVAIAQLTGQVLAFPASTIDATTIIVADPGDPPPGAPAPGSGWYEAFSPSAVTATPIPNDATLSVQYWDGSAWLDIPGMVDIAGPTIFSGAIPTDIAAAAGGIRFVYEADEGTGFGPGTQVEPNLSYTLDAPAPSDAVTIENCVSADAANAAVALAAQQDTACADIDLVPVSPGAGVGQIDKEWDSDTVVERSDSDVSATISWSTANRSNLDRVEITDVPDPQNTPETIAGSVFNAFDLVRLAPITAAMDPMLTFDRIVSVELFSTTTNGWTRAANDPCPDACDGRFPGVTLTTAERASTIAFRLTYEESPTRAERITNVTDPAVGSGVARSTGYDRALRPVFQIRDVTRADASVPVISDVVYNATAPGTVRNVAAMAGYAGADLAVSGSDADDVLITGVPVTVNVTKTWTGGPLAVPPAGTALDDYPSGRVTVTAVNNGPRLIDELTIADPTNGTPENPYGPFATFDLMDVVSLTTPSGIGADSVTITLYETDGSSPVTQRTITRAALLAGTADDFSNVVGIEVNYEGRIDVAVNARLVMDLRLRPEPRPGASGVSIAAGATIDNGTEVRGRDLVDFPDHADSGDRVDTMTDGAAASMSLVTTDIGVDATKALNPDSQTVDDDGPITMTLSGRPSGSARTDRMQLVDVDPRFWNQYDLAGVNPITFTAPINRVQIDALTGATFSVDDHGNPVVTGGTWTDGAASTTATLPAGVDPSEVQGLRITFTRADGAIWENPSRPSQSIRFDIVRRDALRTGGPVLDDTSINAPAPGETLPGVATNEMTAQVWGAIEVGGAPITAIDDAVDTVLFQHRTNEVRVRKSPSGQRAPAAQIPYVLTFTNTGAAPIVNPVITDRIPVDAQGPMVQLDPDIATGTSHYSYSLSGPAPTLPNGTPMPVEVQDVTVEEDPTLLRFTFPEGSVIEPGQTYTITVRMKFRPGLPGNTAVTNTVGITGDSPWDVCDGTHDSGTGECRASTTVSPTRAGALRGDKAVRAVDTELGVVDGTGGSAVCEPDADGFYRGVCTPVTKPGGEEIWRMTFTNTGNLPMDRVIAVDRLPDVGDTGAAIPLPRGSQFRPELRNVELVGSTLGTVSDFAVFYTDSTSPCVADMVAGGSCPDGSWMPWDTSINPADVVALRVEMALEDDMLAPRGTITVDMTTASPLENRSGEARPVAWNTVASAAHTDDNGQHGVAPRSEGNKVGITLATGSLEVLKVVEGLGAAMAPETFDLDLSCTVGDVPISIAEVSSPVTVVPGEPETVDDLPWGATCTVADDREVTGATGFDATAVVVTDDPTQVGLITVTNSYDETVLPVGSVTIDKVVAGDGAELYGTGPFEVRLECVLGPDDTPIDVPGGGTATFAPGEPAVFEDIPIGSRCTATETLTGGASSVAISGESPELVEGQSSGIEITNTFDVGELRVIKRLAGHGADAHRDSEFTFSLACTHEVDGEAVPVDIPGGPTRVVGEGSDWRGVYSDLPTGAECELREIDSGGADVVRMTVGGKTVEVAEGEPVELALAEAAGLCQAVEVVNIWGVSGGDVPPPSPEELVDDGACVAGSGESQPGSGAPDTESAVGASPDGSDQRPSSLARTGATVVVLVLLGMGMFAAGVALIRRRHSTSTVN